MDERGLYDYRRNASFTLSQSFIYTRDRRTSKALFFNFLKTRMKFSSCCDGLCRPSAGRSSSSHQPVPVAVVASVEAKNTSLLYARRRQKHFSTTRPYVKNTSLLYAPTSKTLLYYSTFYLHRLSFYLNTITHFSSFA